MRFDTNINFIINRPKTNTENVDSSLDYVDDSEPSPDYLEDFNFTGEVDQDPYVRSAFLKSNCIVRLGNLVD